MKLSHTLAALLIASVAGVSFAADAPAPVTGPSTTATAPAKAPVKKAAHRKHHAQKRMGKRGGKKVHHTTRKGSAAAPATPAAK